MNAKQTFAAVLTVALASSFASVAMATEATQFDDSASIVTRADVKADLARARADGTLPAGGEASVFVDRPAGSAVARAEVRAEARAVARSHAINALYIGS